MISAQQKEAIIPKHIEVSEQMTLGEAENLLKTLRGALLGWKGEIAYVTAKEFNMVHRGEHILVNTQREHPVISENMKADESGELMDAPKKEVKKQETPKKKHFWSKEIKLEEQKAQSKDEHPERNVTATIPIINLAGDGEMLLAKIEPEGVRLYWAWDKNDKNRLVRIIYVVEAGNGAQ